jgi:hypothetical protein
MSHELHENGPATSTESNAAAQPLPPPARRNVLDDFQRGKVCGMLSVGASRREIAKVLAIHPSTIARTAERDEKFAQELLEAETLCRERPMKAMYAAMESHWRAAAWMLERLHPEQFGRRRGEVYSRGEVREVIDRLLERASAKMTSDDDREELRQAADGLIEEIGKKPPPENPLIQSEKMFEELREYKQQRDRARLQAERDSEMAWLEAQREAEMARLDNQENNRAAKSGAPPIPPAPAPSP